MRAVHFPIHYAPATGPCEVHEWPTPGLASRLFEAMRARHGRGGLNVCGDCLTRARAEAAKPRDEEPRG